MHVGKYVFSQLCEFLPKRAFDCLVTKYEGDKYVKSFSCWNQLLMLLIGQLSHRECMRDLIVSLNAHRSKFHHFLGGGGQVGEPQQFGKSERNTRRTDIPEIFRTHDPSGM